MNHSEVKYLHADASQSIASSPTFDNPQTCVKSKKRATPRRIPGLSTTDERGFLKSDRELLGGKKKPGSLYAALMLGQLRHDFERDKDGKPGHAQRVHEGQYWVAYSLTYWERQLDLTENEARSGVQCLADSDDVVKVAKFKFGNEPKYLHFRLTEKSLGYVTATPVEDGCVATTQGVCANHTATTPTVLSPTVVDSKDSNKGFLPEDPTGVIPEPQQTNSEDQNPTPSMASGPVHQGRVKLSAFAFDKTTEFKSIVRNHLVSQITSFSIGDPKAYKRADDLADCFTYGTLIAFEGEQPLLF